MDNSGSVSGGAVAAEVAAEVAAQVAAESDVAELAITSSDPIAEYEAYVNGLKANVSKEDSVIVLKEARERWLFFEKEFHFWFTTQQMLPGANSVELGWKTIAAKDIKLTKLYAALIKHEVIRGIIEYSNGSSMLKYFTLVNPTWFKTGGHFTNFIEKML